MEWIILIIVLGIFWFFEKFYPKKRTDKKPYEQPEQKKPTAESAQSTRPKPKPETKPKTEHNWQAQEADNQQARETDVLKSRGDGYELHIGRMFERKGDLVIYNGFLRGYDDQGVDLIVISKKDQTVNLVQCKHWKRFEFTTEHLNRIYEKLSSYIKDYDDLALDAIKQYHAIPFTDDELRELIRNSQSFINRKTLYLASDKVIAEDVYSEIELMRTNIYRYQDLKIVINEIR
jgi:hypothetical protein